MSKPPVRFKKLHSEQWNGSISKNYESKRLVQMSSDIKNFITRSMSNEQDPLAKHNLQYEKPEGPSDMFETIATTFNFKHQEGTDPKAELKVIKIILVREGLLMSLKYLTDKSRRNNSVDKSCTSILELLAQIRESTLNYLEALCLWRQTAEETESARVFIWEKRNYTMKIISDLDFLGENALIVSTLGIPQSQFRANPLMLTNNLEDMNTWMDPFERASYDCSGAKEGPQFESRLRLRFAERILLQEIELVNSMSTTGFDDNVFLTQQSSNALNNNNNNISGNNSEVMYLDAPTSHQVPPPFYYGSGNDQLMKGSTALEGEYDDDDDGRLINQDNYLYQAQNEYNTVPARANWVGDEMVRCKSADSNTSMKNPSNPDSRASGISYGFSSAPSSSHGGSRLASLNGSANNLGSGRFHNSQPGSASFEYGHDFFSGNWADSRGITGGIADGGGSSLDAEGGDNPSDIFFLDDGNTQQFIDYEDITNQGGGNRNGGGSAEFFPYGQQHHQEEDMASHQSHKSIDTVSGEDMRYLLNLRAPPKVVVIAASACLILLSSGAKVPTDLTWNAFVNLGRQIDLTEAMFALDPTKLSRFKLVALMPFIEMIQAEGKDFANMNDTSLLYPEFVACTRFIMWVQQFTASGLKKIHKMPHPPAPKTTKAAKKVVLHPIDKTSSEKSLTKSLDKTHKSSTSGGGAGTGAARKSTAGSPSKKQSNSPIRRTVSDGDESVGSNRSRNNKKLVPALAELVPCYKEIVEGKYKNSLLLVVLAANGSNSSLRAVESIAAKVYDIAESKEAVCNIVLREYSLFLKELNDQYDGQASRFFDPEDLNWWTANMRNLINVQSKSSGALKLTISKKSIQNLVLNGLGMAYDDAASAAPSTTAAPSAVVAPATGSKPGKLVIPKPTAAKGQGTASKTPTYPTPTGAAAGAKGRSTTPGRAPSPQTSAKKSTTPSTTKKPEPTAAAAPAPAAVVAAKPSEKAAAPSSTNKGTSEKPSSASTRPAAAAAPAAVSVAPAPMDKALSAKLEKQPSSSTQMLKAPSASKLERPTSVGKSPTAAAAVSAPAPVVVVVVAAGMPSVAAEIAAEEEEEQQYDADEDQVEQPPQEQEEQPQYDDNEFEAPETTGAAVGGAGGGSVKVSGGSVKAATPTTPTAVAASSNAVSPKVALLPSASAAVLEIQANLEAGDSSIVDYEADFDGQPSLAVDSSYAADFEENNQEVEAEANVSNDQIIANVGTTLQQEHEQNNSGDSTNYDIDDLDELPAHIQRQLSSRGKTPANSTMLLDGQTNDAAIRHALSEVITASIMLEAEKDIEEHPEMLHHEKKQLSVIEQAQLEFDDGGNDEAIEEIE